jgi:hypothetical protein
VKAVKKSEGDLVMESSERNPVISQENAGQRQLTRRLIERVQANDVTVEKSGIGLVFTEESASLRFVGGVVQGAGNKMQVNGGAAILQGAGNELRMNSSAAVMQGAGNILQMNGSVALFQGAASTQVHQGCIGLLICGKATITDGSRVLLTTSQAAVLGVSFGLAFALVNHWLHRKSSR